MRDCQCGLNTGSSDPEVTAQQTHKLFDYAGHADWRLREWVALMARYLFGEEGELIQASLLGDPHPAVRRAASFSLSIGSDDPESWTDMGWHPMEESVEPAAPDSDVAQRPCRARAEAVPGGSLSVLLALLDDPLCGTRWAVTRYLPTAEAPAGVRTDLHHDPCVRVRFEALCRFGSPPDIDVESLSIGETLALLMVTEDPAHLTALLGHHDERVRIAIAASPVCPRDLLVRLSRDDNPFVRNTAFCNPSWPADVVTPIPCTGWEEEALPRDPHELAQAVWGTSIRVRCSGGRSMTFNPSGWFHPPKDAVGTCDADAVTLHSWGPFCLTHQDVVDASRQQKGPDGYFGERLRCGLWIPLSQGGPHRPAAELWQGSSHPGTITGAAP